MAYKDNKWQAEAWNGRRLKDRQVLKNGITFAYLPFRFGKMNKAIYNHLI